MRLILIICLISINYNKNIKLVSLLNENISFGLMKVIKPNKKRFIQLILKYQSILNILLKNAKFGIAILAIKNKFKLTALELNEKYIKEIEFYKESIEVNTS